MEYQYIFFDLDGTLTDSGEGILNSVKYTLKEMGYEIPEASVLNQFVGPPLLYSFQHFCGMEEEEARRGVALYREYYARQGLFENRVYDGIEELLKELKAQGKHLAVATSKPEVFSVRVLKHFGLADYFDCIAGSTLDGSRDAKELVIQYACEQLGITDRKQILMVGDRKHDVSGAKACGIACIGVLWGYGSEAELMEAGAVKVIAAPQELSAEMAP